MNVEHARNQKCTLKEIKVRFVFVMATAQYTVLLREHVRVDEDLVEIQERRRLALPADCWAEVPCDAQHEWTEIFYVCHGPGLSVLDSGGDWDYWERQRALGEAFDPNGETKPTLATARRGTVPTQEDVEDDEYYGSRFMIEGPGLWGYLDRIYSNGEDDQFPLFVKSPVDAVLDYVQVVHCYNETDGPMDLSALPQPFTRLQS